jgi:hypothetical protein
MTNQRRITESVRALAAVFEDTNADIGRILGLSESSAAGKRTGRIKWTTDDLAKLAHRYGVTVDQLMAGPRAWLGMSEEGTTPPYVPEMAAMAA